MKFDELNPENARPGEVKPQSQSLSSESIQLNEELETLRRNIEAGSANGEDPEAFEKSLSDLESRLKLHYASVELRVNEFIESYGSDVRYMATDEVIEIFNNDVEETFLILSHILLDESQDPEIRGAVCELISDHSIFAEERFVPLFIKASSTQCQEVQEKLAHNGSQVSDPPSEWIAVLINMHHKGSDSALSALCQLRENSMPQLIEELGIRTGSRSEKALEVFAAIKMEARPAVPAIIRLIEDGYNRESAINVLEEIGPAARSAVPLLTKLLDSDPEVCRLCLSALGKIGKGVPGVATSLVKFVDSHREGDNPGEFDHWDLLAIHDALLALGDDVLEAVPALFDQLERGGLVGEHARMCLINIDPNLNGKILQLQLNTLSSIEAELFPNAARSLSKVTTLTEPIANAFLKAMANPDAGTGVARMYASIFGKYGEQAMPYLLKAIASEGYSFEVLAGALEEVGSPAATACSYLSDRISDEHFYTACCALSALRSIGQISKNKISDLLATLESPNFSVVQHGLALIDTVSLKPNEAMPALSKFLSKAVADIRYNKCLDSAHDAIARFGSSAIPYLLEKLSNDEICILSIFKIIAKIGPEAEDAVPGILNFLDEATKEDSLWHREVAINAVAALGAIGAGSVLAVSKLIGLLECDDSELSLKAAEAIGQIGASAGPDAVAALEHVVEVGDEYISYAALVSLAQINNLTTETALKLMDETKYPHKYNFSHESFKTLGPETIPLLIQLLKDRRGDFGAICDALGEFGSKAAGAIPMMLDGLENSDWWVRRNAAKALREITKHASSEILTALIRAVGDDDFRVRIHAAASLSKLEPENTELIQVYTKLLEDPEPMCRAEGVYGLKKMGSGAKVALPALEHLVEIENTEMVFTIAFKLVQALKNNRTLETSD